jgi:hypothetical protein
MATSKDCFIGLRVAETKRNEHVTVAWLGPRSNPEEIKESCGNARNIVSFPNDSVLIVGEHTVFAKQRKVEENEEEFVEITPTFHSPLFVKIVAEANFGPKEDIPVWLVEFEDPIAANVFLIIWKRMNKEQEHTKGLTKPNWHISKKKNPTFEWQVGSRVELDLLFAKEVGSEEFFPILKKE